MKTIYTNCRIITGGKIISEKDIVAENGYITGIVPHGSVSDGRTVSLGGSYIAPGFIDIHCHGGNGYEFVDGTQEAVIKACEIHFMHGTRIMYPTVSASDREITVRSLEAVEKAADKCRVIIPGVHLEGPYLSPAMCGGQDLSTLRKPEKEEYSALFSRFGKLIARWTYAPEEDENLCFTGFLLEKGITASAGHTAAIYEDIKKAFDCGCRLITHLYSCTSSVTRSGGFRRLGVVESAFLIKDIFVEAIADGKHLPPELLKMIVDIKGTDRVCLVTDSLRPGGYGKEYEGKIFADCAVPFIIEDGVAKLIDRSAFAGSIATADVLLKTAVNAGIPLAESVRMLTETPAEIMELKEFGKIEAGYKELFTAFDDEFNIVEI